MNITEKTKEYECCCSCKHNIRKKDEKGGIYCECEIDKHYIGYIPSFEMTCERWVKEAKIYGQLNERTEECTETHECDCISREGYWIEHKQTEGEQK